LSAKDSKPKPLFIQLLEIKKSWRELWFAMADGSKAEYDRIKATDVTEFWYIFDAWKERIDAQKQAARNSRR
jgi:hypothetical protein